MNSADSVAQKGWEDLPEADQVALFSGLRAALNHMTEEELTEALPGFVWDVVQSSRANAANEMNMAMCQHVRHLEVQAMMAPPRRSLSDALAVHQFVQPRVRPTDFQFGPLQ